MVLLHAINETMPSMRVPPAARMPSFYFYGELAQVVVAGIVSIQVFATPIMGLRKPSSVKPMASITNRAGARCRSLRDH
jgi:hypothetical protein